MCERSREGAGAPGALHQRHEATDERQEHEHAGVVAVSYLGNEVLAYHHHREQAPHRRIREQQHAGAHPDKRPRITLRLHSASASVTATGRSERGPGSVMSRDCHSRSAARVSARCPAPR